MELANGCVSRSVNFLFEYAGDHLHRVRLAKLSMLLRSIFERQQLDAELDEELREQIEQEIGNKLVTRMRMFRPASGASLSAKVSTFGRTQLVLAFRGAARTFSLTLTARAAIPR
jgi:hypothetical protein